MENIQLKQVRMYKTVHYFILVNHPFLKNELNTPVRVKMNMDYLGYTRHSLVPHKHGVGEKAKLLRSLAYPLVILDFFIHNIL